MKVKLALGLLLACGIYGVLQSEDSIGVTSGADMLIPAERIYVIDGDTIGVGEERYRLMGFDTPETKRAGCAEEQALGKQATRRLRALIDDARAVTLKVQPKRDRYNRYLAHAYVFDQNVADILISEGLARPYSGGKRMPWCSAAEKTNSWDGSVWKGTAMPNIALSHGGIEDV